MRAALYPAAAGEDARGRPRRSPPAGHPAHVAGRHPGGLRRAGPVTGRRGGRGGYGLARPADTVGVADVIRAVDGPLVSVRGMPPAELSYPAPAEAPLPLWIAPRVNVRRILGEVPRRRRRLGVARGTPRPRRRPRGVDRSLTPGQEQARGRFGAVSRPPCETSPGMGAGPLDVPTGAPDTPRQDSPVNGWEMTGRPEPADSGASCVRLRSPLLTSRRHIDLQRVCSAAHHLS
ncbi:Rrf2 family transcriptional regulator [Streptomyces sp. NPDC019539]|uniref:Rrf2 family transcriptional regulator n=1 Tax=Streptomyces sp. NPDC019539 TaxID=3365063 RepID=UPI0037AFE852